MIIEDDVLFITEQLKMIDETYFVKYDESKKRYEVHSTEQPVTSFCFAVPYKELDERTLELARKSRIENRQKLIEELDRQNEKLEGQKRREIKHFAMEQGKEIYNVNKRCD